MQSNGGFLRVLLLMIVTDMCNSVSTRSAISDKLILPLTIAMSLQA